MKPALILLPLAALVPAFPATAQETAVCEAAPSLSEPWTGWTQGIDIQAGTQADGASTLALGQSAVARLSPAGDMRFAAAPGKGAQQGFGGLFVLEVKSAARIGIALSAGAWVDVIEGGQPLASVEHGHGPQCSGIRKIVWFDLKPGRPLVQIAGAPDAAIRIMAAGKPAA